MNNASTKLMDEDLSTCIDDCLRCYRTCLDTVVKRGLAEEASRIEAKHIRLVLTCAEMCRTAAHLMLLRSPHHRQLCEGCAAICSECARECGRVGGMEECAEACRFCADSCQAMAI